MKRIFSSRKNKSPHNKEESERFPTPFFTRESRTPFFSGTAIQPKLTVGKPGDKYEKEADTMADAVVNNSSQPAVQNKEISSIQRESLATPLEDEKLGTAEQRMEEDKLVQQNQEIQKREQPEEEEMISMMEAPKEEEEMVQAKGEAGPKTASPGLSQQLKAKAGKGKNLPENTRMEMESSFGTDFSGIHIHTDQVAVHMNKELRSQAFTYGRDIYFNSGKYNPDTSYGKHLLAHELTHTIQQNSFLQTSPTVQRTIGDTLDLSSPRFKGDPDLEACFDGEKIIRAGSKGEFVRKIQRALMDAGFDLPKFGADSIFGPETKAAVREFQRQSGLQASELDGEVGPNTMSRLDSRFTGSSASKVEKTCESGIKTVTIDVVMMKGATGNAVTDIASANAAFGPCCIQFRLGRQVTMSPILSDLLMGGDTDFLVGECGTVSSEDLSTFLTSTFLFGLSNPIIAFYVDSLHTTGGERLRGVSVSPLCGTGPREPMVGMMSKANGADDRTFPHELAHILMNTFADHRVTAANLQHISTGSTGVQIAPVQCAIMYTRV